MQFRVFLLNLVVERSARWSLTFGLEQTYSVTELLDGLPGLTCLPLLCPPPSPGVGHLPELHRYLLRSAVNSCQYTGRPGDQTTLQQPNKDPRSGLTRNLTPLAHISHAACPFDALIGHFGGSAEAAAPRTAALRLRLFLFLSHDTKKILLL